MTERESVQYVLPLNLAVIEQAVWDWKQLCIKGAKGPGNRSVCAAMREIRALRRFFKSRLCAFYLNGFVSQKKLIGEMEAFFSGSLLEAQANALRRQM